MSFFEDLTILLNRYNYERESQTPDWMLAEYLITCLNAWNDSVRKREEWYGRPLRRWQPQRPVPGMPPQEERR